MRTPFLLIIAVAIVAAGILTWWVGREPATTTADLPNTIPDEEVEVADPADDIPEVPAGDAANQPDASDNAMTSNQDSDSEMTDEETAEETTVRYGSSGFSPETVTISAGETVQFMNERADPMWVASDEHPTHTEYSGTSRNEHCGPGDAEEAFDQCESGDSFTFTFTQTGSWDYHNHLNPSDGGTIVVE